MPEKDQSHWLGTTQALMATGAECVCPQSHSEVAESSSSPPHALLQAKCACANFTNVWRRSGLVSQATCTILQKNSFGLVECKRKGNGGEEGCIWGGKGWGRGKRTGGAHPFMWHKHIILQADRVVREDARQGVLQLDGIRQLLMHHLKDLLPHHLHHHALMQAGNKEIRSFLTGSKADWVESSIWVSCVKSSR